MPKVFGQLQPLALIVRADSLPVNFRRRIGESLEHEPPDDLAMLDDKRHFAGADFQQASQTLHSQAIFMMILFRGAVCFCADEKS